MFSTVCSPRRTSDTSMSVDGPRNHRYPHPLHHRYAKLLATVPVSLCLLACAKSIEQEVTGRLSSTSGTTGKVQVRLYESPLCSGNFTETTTNKSGEFAFRTRTVTGTVSEFKQELALCEKQNGYWRPLWSSVHRAGANPIELMCTEQKEGKPACVPKFNYGA